MDGDPSMAAQYAMDAGGLSPEDQQWLMDAEAELSGFVVDNQEVIKQESFDVSEMFPGQNVPSSIIRAGVSPSVQEAAAPVSKNTMMIAGGVAVVGLIFFMTKK